MAYSFESIYDTLTEMRTCPYQGITKNYGYRTLGRTSVYDGGQGEYDWHPESLLDDDDAIVIKPNNLPVFMPGRWHARPNADGVLDLASAGFDTTGQTDQAEKLLKILFLAKSMGIPVVLLPNGRIDIRSWPSLADPYNSVYRGLSNITLRGRGQGKSTLSAKVAYTTLITDVRLINTGSLPAMVASGSGVGKTLTAVSVGAVTIDATALNLNDLVLQPYTGQGVTQKDTGIYKVTQVGTGAAKLILTRAPGFDSTLQVRTAVRATAGVTNLRTWWVLSNRADQFWADEAMTMDVTSQYWTAEEYVAGAVSMAPAFEVDPFRSSIPSLSAQHWNQWVTGGTSTLTNVSFLAGGAWTDPDTGRSYTLKAVAPGDKWFRKMGITPTDQGWTFDEDKCTVMSVDPTNKTVVVDKMAARTSIMSRRECSQGTISAVGANSYTLSIPANADLAQNGDFVIVNGRSGIGTVTARDPLTGTVTVSGGTLPAGTAPGDKAYVLETALVSLGTVNAVGAGTFTCTVPANAGLLSPGDHVYGVGRTDFGQVLTRNATTGVVTFGPIDGNVSALNGLVNGDTVLKSTVFPLYNLNQAGTQFRNEYHRIVTDAENLTFEDFTLDSCSMSFNFCSNTTVRRVTIANTHIALAVGGCDNFLTEDVTERNCNGFNFAGHTASNDVLSWYGYANQRNYSKKVTDSRIFGDGISGNWADQESENEGLWVSTKLVLAPTPVDHSSMFIGGTTPNVINRNPTTDMVVRGGVNANTRIMILDDPCHNLTFDAMTMADNVSKVAINTNWLTGSLFFAGKRFNMSARIHWKMFIPLQAATNKAVWRPYDGLWVNSRMMISTTTGITTWNVLPYAGVGGGNFAGVIANNFVANEWFYPGFDDMNHSQPNAADELHQYMQIITDGTLPANSWAMLEGDVVPQVNRGDGLEGLSSYDLSGPAPTPNLMKRATDFSIGARIYTNGTPVALGIIPLYPGLQCLDYGGNTLWEAMDSRVAADWMRIG